MKKNHRPLYVIHYENHWWSVSEKKWISRELMNPVITYISTPMFRSKRRAFSCFHACVTGSIMEMFTFKRREKKGKPHRFRTEFIRN